jgi:hypothetical protein
VVHRLKFTKDPTERARIFKEMVTCTVRGYSELLLDSLRQGMKNFLPDKVTIEFGLQMGGEAGVPFVTKGTAQANVKVSVEWDLQERRRSQDEPV